MKALTIDQLKNRRTALRQKIREQNPFATYAYNQSNLLLRRYRNLCLLIYQKNTLPCISKASDKAGNLPIKELKTQLFKQNK